LVPIHNWLPDAHSEGPTPISAVLSGLLLNIALYAIVRCKVLVDGSTGTHHSGNIMMGFGIISIMVASFSLLRQKDIKRLFAYSSIEHMGIATFGVFTSEFLILTATIKDAPLLAPFLLLGLGVSFAALFRRVQPMVMGTIPPYQHRLKVAHIPVILHLALVLVLGLYMPKFLAGWFQSAVELLK
jgi:formate hydrogenlyase subunit 3/multisubunit Na+/H+ antiporter MnhD subunit